MAQVITNARMWLAEYALSSIANAVTVDNSRNMVAATTIGDGSEVFSPGVIQHTVGAAGFIDSTLDGALYTDLGVADQPFTVAPEDGGAAGEPCYIANFQSGSYNVSLNHGEAHTFDLSGSAPFSLAGTVLYNGSIAASGTVTTTAYQLGAVASGQSLYMTVHVTAIGGTSPTVDIILESDDNGSFTSGTTRITVSQFTAIGSSWESVVGPITDDYWRAQITVAGTTPTTTVTLAAGIR